MSEKRIPLPCTIEEYKTIKTYCIINNLKYEDLFKLLIKVIKEKK